MKENERNQMNQMIGEYKTVTGTPEELDQKVNAAIKEGFQPFGNPYSLSTPRSAFVLQAMVKPQQGPTGFEKASAFGSGA